MELTNSQLEATSLVAWPLPVSNPKRCRWGKTSRQFRSRGWIPGTGGQGGRPSKFLKPEKSCHTYKPFTIHSFCFSIQPPWLKTYQRASGPSPWQYPCHNSGHRRSPVDARRGWQKCSWKRNKQQNKKMGISIAKTLHEKSGH